MFKLVVLSLIRTTGEGHGDQMENYSKARTSEQPSVCPFPGLPPDTPEVRVKDGSKIRNLLRYALSRMEAKPRAAEETGSPAPEEGGVAVEGQQEAPGQPLCKHIIFTASGKGVSKAITCAEIVKRRVKGLHQLTRLLYSSVVEVWEPLEPAAGLDSLTVNRNLPAIWILLSRDQPDCGQPGYQAPGRYDGLWVQSANREEGGGLPAQRPGHRRKRGGGGGGEGSSGGRGKGAGRKTVRSRDAAK
ncbi:ribonuclease P protein subunit p25-like protein isoform X1 [Platichthys flesus]|uniref:ribonuclease P protein subunit p25-like protein isoform X1 n=1 Tax=Platichthys flesus TaxID=8260 RepID=UPI002DBF706A|nr:ribonuclease P protein subunit p25-like protein isoform X1 [Platichthys flesus]